MAQGGYIAGDVRVAYASGASPFTWKKVEGLMDLTAPFLQTKKIETTRYSSNRLMTNIPGLDEVVDPVLKLIRDADVATSPNQNALFGIKNARTTLRWRFEIASQDDPSVNLFEAYEGDFRVSTLKETVNVGALNNLDVTLIFSGNDFTHYASQASEIG